MPLLAEETAIFPPELFSLDRASHPWGVAHVRSRQEKVLARFLADRGIPFYLPIASVKRRSGPRTLTSHLPLFAGYVFHRAPDAQRDLLWRSNAVANLIDVEDQQQLEDELAQIRSLQMSGASLRVIPQLVQGQAVRIVEGVFAGYTGVVERGKGSDRLIIRVSLLRQAVCVEFDRDVLKPASPSS